MCQSVTCHQRGRSIKGGVSKDSIIARPIGSTCGRTHERLIAPWQPPIPTPPSDSWGFRVFTDTPVSIDLAGLNPAEQIPLGWQLMPWVEPLYLCACKCFVEKPREEENCKKMFLQPIRSKMFLSHLWFRINLKPLIASSCCRVCLFKISLWWNNSADKDTFSHFPHFCDRQHRFMPLRGRYISLFFFCWKSKPWSR